MPSLATLQETIGVRFRDEQLLAQALVHRSYINEHPSHPTGHNERLEFLGDAVLELVVTEFLYTTYDNPEGELTNWRAALVNGKMLATIARTIAIEPLLKLSRGESKEQNIKARDYILANAFEALIGAIYLDQGYDRAKVFISNFLLPELPRILEHQLHIDPKSRFQEEAQMRFSTTPTYTVIEESGPDHKKNFVIAVSIGAEEVARGTGMSKQEAQMAAAENALKTKGW
jgi:ribonuclease-3